MRRPGRARTARTIARDSRASPARRDLRLSVVVVEAMTGTTLRVDQQNPTKSPAGVRGQSRRAGIWDCPWSVDEAMTATTLRVNQQNPTKSPAGVRGHSRRAGIWDCPWSVDEAMTATTLRVDQQNSTKSPEGFGAIPGAPGSGIARGRWTKR